MLDYIFETDKVLHKASCWVMEPIKSLLAVNILPTTPNAWVCSNVNIAVLSIHQVCLFPFSVAASKLKKCRSHISRFQTIDWTETTLELVLAHHQALQIEHFFLLRLSIMSTLPSHYISFLSAGAASNSLLHTDYSWTGPISANAARYLWDMNLLTRP